MNGQEQWQDVPGYEGVYRVSNQGRVKRLAGSPKCLKERVLKPIVQKGYHYVCLSIESVVIRIGVHQLVLLAFVGPSLGLWTNHKSGIKHDNRPENLEYVTPGENAKHAYAIGLQPDRNGYNNPAAKLTPEVARQIRALASAGVSRREIVKQIGFGKTTVRNVIVGKSWRNLDG